LHGVIPVIPVNPGKVWYDLVKNKNPQLLAEGFLLVIADTLFLILSNC
jgi:hypothetical protein